MPGIYRGGVRPHRAAVIDAICETHRMAAVDWITRVPSDTELWLRQRLARWQEALSSEQVAVPVDAKAKERAARLFLASDFAFDLALRLPPCWLIPGKSPSGLGSQKHCLRILPRAYAAIGNWVALL